MKSRLLSFVFLTPFKDASFLYNTSPWMNLFIFSPLGGEKFLNYEKS